MQGSQALIAFKDNGSVVVKTYSISSYQGVVPGNLSFEVWDLSAEAGNDGKTVIYGSLKVPASTGKLNQVWQVGPITDGHPGKHEFGKENLGSMGELNLVEKAGSDSSSPASAPNSAIPTLTPSPATTPQADAKNQTGSDGWKVRELNGGFWILGLVSILLQQVLM